MTVTPADDTTRDGELRALERAMGAVVVNSSQDWGGEIADDDDDDSDRVVYDDEALFDDDDPLPPQGEAAALAEPADLTGLLGDGGAESSSALIAYLEQMAADGGLLRLHQRVGDAATQRLVGGGGGVPGQVGRRAG